VLAAAEFVVRLDRELVPDLDDARLREGVRGFLSSVAVVATVRRKKEQKPVDLRAAVEELAVADESAVPEWLGFRRPGARYLRMVLAQNGPVHARPEEVAAAVLGADPGLSPAHLVRTRFLSRTRGGFAPLLFEPDGSRCPEPVSL
jgi:hypothetical protein